jgi:hypothetical protein
MIIIIIGIVFHSPDLYSWFNLFDAESLISNNAQNHRDLKIPTRSLVVSYGMLVGHSRTRWQIPYSRI